MGDNYFTILKYIDDLHEGISLLVDYVETGLKAESYSAFPKARNRINWHLSNDLYRPFDWRLSYVSRLFIRDAEKSKKQISALLLHVSIHWYCAFKFPSILCGKLYFEPSTEDEIYRDVWNTSEICTLIEKEGTWESFEKEDGWCLAKPSYETRTTKIKGYFLNAFDIDEPKKVDNNIIRPLMAIEGKNQLADMLTVKMYEFPGVG